MREQPEEPFEGLQTYGGYAPLPEVARFLGLTEARLSEAARDGRLRAAKWGKGPAAKWMVKPPDVARYLQEYRPGWPKGKPRGPWDSEQRKAARAARAAAQAARAAGTTNGKAPAALQSTQEALPGAAASE